MALYRSGLTLILVAIFGSFTVGTASCFLLNNCTTLINGSCTNLPIKENFCSQPPTNITNLIKQVNQKQQRRNKKIATRQIGPLRKKQLYDAVYSSQNLKIVDELFFTGANDKYPISDNIRLSLLAKIQGIIYSDLLMHQYDSLTERIASGGPLVNQELCLRQLREINIKASNLSKTGINSNQWKFFQFMDTFGRHSPGMSSGNLLWVGSYDECLKLQINLGENQVETRYCLASIKHQDWPDDNALGVASLKIGVCLPKACDSMNYKNKYELINSLISFNRREIDKEEQQLSDLYCLPDAQSSLRAWWRQPKTILFLTGCLAWLALLVYATIKSENVRIKIRNFQKQQNQQQVENKSLSSDNIHQLETSPTISQQTTTTTYILSDDEKKLLATFGPLSIVNNFRNLWCSKKRHHQIKSKKETNIQSGGSSVDTSTDRVSAPTTDKPVVVADLSVLDGIKVLCTLYITFGHVLMCMVMLVKNGRDFASTTSPAYLLSHSVPAFAVNSFFTITGLLTTYMIFKENKSHSVITSPAKWTALMIYRYLRIMPTYLFVVLYAKLVAKYTGSGPFWDYATSSLAHRRVCEQESVVWTVLYAANFKSPFDHCIASAWYLSNDFQFFLATPIFVYVLYKSEYVGILLLKSCVALGTIAGFISIYTSNLDDMRPIANFKPIGFKLYVTYLNNNYTYPQFRIASYLLGLLFGYILYKYEQEQREYLEKQKEQEQREKDEDKTVMNSEPPNWSEYFLKNGSFWCIIIILICLLLPPIGMQLPFNKFYARIAVALFMPAFHILFSVSVGWYTLLASTGYGYKWLNDFLSAQFWKPYAKLSLCCLLVNLEVITYLMQTRTEVQHIDNQYLTSVGLYCIISVYLVSTVTYVLVEAPVKSALNQLVSLLRARTVTKEKIC